MSLALRIAASVLALSAAPAAVPAARAGDASAWSPGHHSRVRLVAGGSIEGGARRLAGIEIRLDPGYKTYWRNPGDAGLPPTFDWSASRNVRAVEVAWPAPERLEDAGGVSFGYHDGVVLPLTVTPERPGAPVEVAVDLHYGVCKGICIPAQARLRLPLPEREGAQGPLIRQALARVPRRAPVGEGPLAVVSAAMDGGAIRVTVRSPGGTPTLAAEAPDGWYLGVPAAGPDGTHRIEILERPKGAHGHVPLTLTLVSGAGAVETTLDLDAGPSPR